MTDTDKMRALNDAFRTTFVGGTVVFTRGATALDDGSGKLAELVRKFDAFTEDNDPNGEHDFGQIKLNGIKCFWKIDYYDKSLTYGSDNPADPEKTTRILTVMRADEY